MSGEIANTSAVGGRILRDTGGYIFFDWRDAIDLAPNNCGHGTKVICHIDSSVRHRALST